MPTLAPQTCFYCGKPMEVKVIKMWGYIYCTCKTPDCPIDEFRITMKLEMTPAAKILAPQGTTK